MTWMAVGAHPQRKLGRISPTRNKLRYLRATQPVDTVFPVKIFLR